MGYGQAVQQISSMASSTMPIVLSLLLVLCFPYTMVVVSAGQAPSCYKRLFSLGDSITDTGNLARVTPNIPTMAFPYGETFFHRPTGRYCDGRLIVDFIGMVILAAQLSLINTHALHIADFIGVLAPTAEALKLPLLTPFLAGKTARGLPAGGELRRGQRHGAEPAVLQGHGAGREKIPPFSLDVQVEWFKRVLHMLGPTEQERKEIMSNSLFLLGEIGGNDHNHPFFQNRSFSAESSP
ncbi:hypothetical protein HU200_034719 [Digitaria exilis]|uniref:GDSL esterase/lipase n=1 Tax=Digitaria exilis TaxID=1010633 RepID=A0A835BIX2_9POAL|nr:hypothetical protein HU200_034719 [Digitaria exilis]